MKNIQIFKSITFLFFSLLFIFSCGIQEKNNIQVEVKTTSSNIQVDTVQITEIIKRPNNQGIPFLNWSMSTDPKSSLNFKSSIRSIFQDSKGNMWFGSNKEGVCSYDGKSFTYYTMEDGLCNPQIRTIQEDKDGKIWFGTGNGVAYFDGESISCSTETTLSSQRKLKHQASKDLKQKWNHVPDALWFDAGPNNGVYRYNGKELEYLAFPIPEIEYGKNDFEDSYSVYSIYQDRNGNVWFGTVQKGVICYNGSSFKYINESDLNAVVRSISQDRDGNMWFGNNGAGVFHYDGKTLINFTKKHGLSNPNFLNGNFTDRPGTMARIWAIEQDRAGNMWFATIDAGLWKYDGESLTNFTTKNGLISHSIESIYQDKKGNLWIGTSKGGLHLFDGKSFFQFTGMDC